MWCVEDGVGLSWRLAAVWSGPEVAGMMLGCEAEVQVGFSMLGGGIASSVAEAARWLGVLGASGPPCSRVCGIRSLRLGAEPSSSASCRRSWASSGFFLCAEWRQAVYLPKFFFGAFVVVGLAVDVFVIFACG